MSDTSIGGFYAALGIKTDHDSFDRAFRSIEKTTNSVNRFIATMKSAAAVLGIDKLTQLEAQELYTADAIGLSTEQLDKWQIAATLAGSKAESLVASMNKINRAITGERLGIKADESLVTNLSKLGIDWNSFKGIDADNRISAIFDAASQYVKSAENQEDAYSEAMLLVESVIGADGRKMFQYMSRNNLTAEDLLNKSSSINFTTEESKQNSENFQVELRELKASVASIAALGIGELAKPLTSIVGPLNDWIQSHGEDIQNAIGFAAEKIQDFVDWGIEQIPTLTKAVGFLSESVNSVWNWLTNHFGDGRTKEEREEHDKIIEERIKGIERAFDVLENESVKKGWWSQKKEFNKLSEAAKEQVLLDPLSYYRYVSGIPEFDYKSLLYNDDEAEINNLMLVRGTEKRWKSMNDGIISPTGQLTQVAQDDWVIAAKDLSNLGAAFMPEHNMTNNASYTINQTINVNGNTSAQTIRQQAYNGAKGGLMEALEMSNRRLQLMPQAR